MIWFKLFWLRCGESERGLPAFFFAVLRTLRGMNTCIRIALVGIVGGVPASLAAQTPAVLNGSFENYSTAPSAPGQWFHVPQWGNAGSAEASPDFFHEDGSGGGDLPETPLAMLDAFAGKGVMGFTAATTDGSSRREYVVGRFSEPLEPGQHYRLRFAITNGEVTAFSPAGAAVSGLAVACSESAPLQAGLAPLKLQPQFQFAAPFYNREWEEVAFTFTAGGAWNHFAVGVFAPDEAVDFEVVEGANPQMAYYFVDAFELELASQEPEEVSEVKGPVDVEAVSPEAEVADVPWFVPNAFSPNGDGENDRFMPVINRGELIGFEVYSRWGELLFESRKTDDLAWDGTDSKGKPVPVGMYVWKLRMKVEGAKRTEESGMLTLIR